MVSLFLLELEYADLLWKYEWLQENQMQSCNLFLQKAFISILE